MARNFMFRRRKVGYKWLKSKPSVTRAAIDGHLIGVDWDGIHLNKLATPPHTII